MRFGEVIRRSVYGTTGYLKALADLHVVEQVVVHNLPILTQFRQVLVATNYGPGDRSGLAAANARLWRSYLPDCVLLDSPVNRGHSIGAADLDVMLFDHCKRTRTRWLCKGANDVLLDPPVLGIDVEEASFHFLPAVSYSAIEQQGFDLDRMARELFYPQTTFYAIDVDATDFLVDRSFLDRSWSVVNRIPGYNGRIWEYVPGWSCEHLLRQCVLRNGLTRCPLLSDEQFRRLLHLVVDLRIEDCSHKGLVINGICHLHPERGRTDVIV